MDKLHLGHTGFKLPIAVFPPLLSGMLCPTWKLKQLPQRRPQIFKYGFNGNQIKPPAASLISIGLGKV